MANIIVLTGMPGAGKEEFVSVAHRHGYQIIRMGDVVREEALRQGVAMDDGGLGGFASSERQRHGAGIWAHRCLERIGTMDTVIDGSRSLAELEVFRRSLGPRARLVAVHTSPEERFRRLQRRARADAPRDRQEFDRRDHRELEWGLGGLIAMADSMLVNQGTLEHFQELSKKEVSRPW